MVLIFYSQFYEELFYLQVWNKLPEDVKLADDINVFKSKPRSVRL